MCGLIAWLGRESLSPKALQSALDKMYSRGPDDHGFWRDDGVALGHRRLAIQDLNHRAAQPMHSHCGRYVIVFNGEIYNFHELRRDMASKGVTFHTNSDTEVLLALFALKGESMLSLLRGMFAFVIWDTEKHRAFVARDPYGIKPLYIARTKNGILLGSQVKALMATGMVSSEPDLRGQAGFWLLGSVPEPHTWYRNVQALPAGHSTWVEDGKLSPPHCWFDIGDIWRNAEVAESKISDAEVREGVQSALSESVAAHLVADVPVGVFLSGGIDSGALVGLMLEAGAQQLEGITITYDEFVGQHEDESPVAARIAAHYGIRHHVRRVTREEFQADLPKILNAMDQPSIDGINTWYASKAVAERGLKVVVSGVGGDELFQGYSKFQELPRLLKRRRLLGKLPWGATLLRVVGKLQAKRSGNNRWLHLAEWSNSLEGAWWLRRSVFSPEELPALMGSEQADKVLSDFDASQWVRDMSGLCPADHLLALSQIESSTYLRNQLLRDSDWASMDHSIELRTPLVDAHLLQQLRPLMQAFSRYPNKTLLAEAPSRPLPNDVIKRPKTGFGIPVSQWLAELQTDIYGCGSKGWAWDLVRKYESLV